MTAESCRAAVPDGAQHLQLRPCQMIPVSVDEAVARCANDVGHLQGGPIHLSLSGRIAAGGFRAAHLHVIDRIGDGLQMTL